jgi:hypothetical protein
MVVSAGADVVSIGVVSIGVVSIGDDVLSRSFFASPDQALVFVDLRHWSR